MKKYLSVLLALLAVMCFLAVPANAQGNLILPLEPMGEQPVFPMGLTIGQPVCSDGVQATVYAAACEPGQQTSTLLHITGERLSDCAVEIDLGRFMNYAQLDSYTYDGAWAVQGVASGENIQVCMEVGDVTLVYHQPFVSGRQQATLYRFSMRDVPDVWDTVMHITIHGDVSACDLIVSLPFATCEPSGLILGDVNGDYAVNNKDYASLKRLLADIAEPSDWQADVNDDGMYNNKDLARLKLVLADTFI